MDIASYFLFTLGAIGICLSIALVKCGYGKSFIGALSKSSRKAVNMTKRFMRGK